MEKLKKIPVIGYLIRLLAAIVKLPKHLDAFYEMQEIAVEERSKQEKKLSEEYLKQEQILKKLKTINEKVDSTINQFSANNRDRQEEIWNLQKEDARLFDANKDRQNEIWQLQNFIEELREGNKDRYTETSNLTKRLDKYLSLDVNDEYLQKLNVLLSSHYTLWGDKSRLHISELAAVGSCTFNTNSGEIYIGDYTFSGSGVSILAGSHDMKLTGLLRRDVEEKESCDIVIGNGVWLASNCSILGPAKIGDNSVIAAGAVVVPGTEIPPNTVYAGIPAKYMKTIRIENNGEIGEEIKNALERSNGVLYVSGWTEKKEIGVDNKMLKGHYMIKDEATVYTTKQQITLIYLKDDVDEEELEYYVDDLRHDKTLDEKKGTIEISCSKSIESIHKIVFRVQEINDGLFFGEYVTG